MDDASPLQSARKTLRRQLELARLGRGVEVVDSLAERRMILSTGDLARLNNILTGSHESPWRQEPITITLRSGVQETLSSVTDPVVCAREKLHLATERAEAGQVVEAAVGIYVDLIRNHVFKDANRRTAVLACHFFLNRYGIRLSGLALHEVGIGDIRDPAQVEALQDIVRQMAKFAARQ